MAEKIERAFDDPPQYCVTKKMAAGSIVSFNKHFDGLDVPRVEPASALGEAE